MGTSISNIITVTTPPLGVLPGPATGLTLSNITATSVTLSWVAPVMGGLPFNFQPQVSVGTTGVWTNFGTLGPATSATASGLATNTAYLFRVLTENSSGTSTSATVSQTTLSIAPGAPTGLAVVSATATSVSLQWVAPLVGTPPFTFQVAFRTPSGSGAFTPFTSTTTGLTQTITGLTSGAAYDFTVTASNGAGAGAASAALLNVPTTTTNVAPSAPSNLTAGAVTANSVAVSWTASATGTPPVSYQVQWRLH